MIKFRSSLIHSFAFLLIAAGAEAKSRPRAAATPPPILLNPDSSDSTAAPQSHGLISSEIGGQDLAFLTTAIELGKMELWLGDQAAKAESSEIKAVGETLKSSQAEENILLTHVAEQKHVPVSGGKALPMEARRLALDYAKLTGSKFDKTVMEKIVAVNQEAVTNYEGAMHSRDEEIKHLAERLLPIAKEKLQLAGKMNGTAPRTSAAPGFHSGGPSGLKSETPQPKPESPSRKPEPPSAKPEPLPKPILSAPNADR